LENIIEGANAWTWVSLTLIAATLLVATLTVQPLDGGLRIGLTGKFFAVAAALAALHFIVRHRLSEDELRDWSRCRSPRCSSSSACTGARCSPT
jgi:hypothetical protein